MDLDVLNRYLAGCRYVYFSNVFTLTCQALAVITILPFLKKNSLAKLFFAYSFAAFLLFTVIDIFSKLDVNGNSQLREVASLVFSFIEYLVFYRFFRSILDYKNIKKAMAVFMFLLTISSLIFLLSGFNIAFTSGTIRVFADFFISSELFFLAGLCLIYYYQLINKKNTSHLLSNPSFWIVTGLFLYSIIIAPFFMITDAVGKSYKIFYSIAFAIHYTTFGLLFLAIAKAFRLRKPLTT